MGWASIALFARTLIEIELVLTGKMDLAWVRGFLNLFGD